MEKITSFYHTNNEVDKERSTHYYNIQRISKQTEDDGSIAFDNAPHGIQYRCHNTNIFLDENFYSRNIKEICNK